MVTTPMSGVITIRTMLLFERLEKVYVPDEDSLRYWQTRTHCCGHIVPHDVSHVAQTGKHLLRTQNVSDQNQKHFWCPGHKICVRNKCCARGQTGKHLCRQQCVRKNVSSFASTFRTKNEHFPWPALQSLQRISQISSSPSALFF